MYVIINSSFFPNLEMKIFVNNFKKKLNATLIRIILMNYVLQRLFSPDFNPRMFESAISPKNLSKNRNKDFLPSKYFSLAIFELLTLKWKRFVYPW